MWHWWGEGEVLRWSLKLRKRPVVPYNHVEFYNFIKSNTFVSLQAGGCCMKKSWRNSMQLIKKYAVWIYTCIHHGVGRIEKQLKMVSGSGRSCFFLQGNSFSVIARHYGREWLLRTTKIAVDIVLQKTDKQAGCSLTVDEKSKGLYVGKGVFIQATLSFFPYLASLAVPWA